MNEVLTCSLAASNLPDFEMSDFSDVDVKSGIIRMFDSNGIELDPLRLNEVLDYIEANELNEEVFHTNKSHDGNPEFDEEHFYTVPALDYLKRKCEAVLKGFYLTKVSHDRGNR